MLHFCSSNGKYFTSIMQELLNMIMDSHVTLPSCDTMTLVLMLDMYDETSALYVERESERSEVGPWITISYGLMTSKVILIFKPLIN